MAMSPRGGNNADTVHNFDAEQFGIKLDVHAQYNNIMDIVKAYIV